MGPQAVQPVVAADNGGMDGKSGSFTEPRVVEFGEQATAVVAGVVPVADLRNFFDGAFQELLRCLAGGGFTPSGVALAFYRSVPSDTVDFEVGFPSALSVSLE